MLMRLKISNTDTHGVQGVASSNPAAPTKIFICIHEITAAILGGVFWSGAQNA